MAKSPTSSKGAPPRTRRKRGRYTLADTMASFEVGLEVGDLMAQRRAREAAAMGAFVNEIEAFLQGVTSS